MHNDTLLVGLAVVLVAGILAQWLAWRLRLPSILVLLVAGFLVGPITGLINPDDLLGDLLTPVVSLAVGIVLFEGGLTLQLDELRTIGKVVRNLVSLGALLTWASITAAAHFVLGYSLDLAVLLGAILVVTGPTVIGPLLRYIGPVGQVGSALKWEGIIIDPIGATLAVLVFEVLRSGTLAQDVLEVVGGVVRTIVIGGGCGLLGALVMTAMLRRKWIPESLDVPFTLMVVVGAFTLADWFQVEAGLLATTVMGFGLANQRYFAVKHILEFKENLRVLLIATLFILLSARLPLDGVLAAATDWRTWLFLLIVMLVVRPLGVAASTVGSVLSRKERVLLASVAPRGIVAASISSIFAIRLVEAGNPEAASLVSITFITIIVTVLVYGLAAGPLARWLGLAAGHPQGLLFVGAHAWARAIAASLKEAGVEVLLADSNRANIRAAQLDGLQTFYGNILAEGVEDVMNLEGYGRLLALTPNDEINSLAAIHFRETVGPENVYQLDVNGGNATRSASEGPALQLRGHTLFGPDITYQRLSTLFARGAVVKRATLTAEFAFQDLREAHRGEMIPLFVITPDDRVEIHRADSAPPTPGDTVIFVASPEDASRGVGSQARPLEP